MAQDFVQCNSRMLVSDGDGATYVLCNKQLGHDGDHRHECDVCTGYTWKTETTFGKLASS
jgi:hypothetical protein